MRTQASIIARLMIVVGVCVPGVVFAANEGAVTVTANPHVSALAQAADTGLVSLDFQDADIRNVLKVLAFKSGVNIIAGMDVTGVVTIQLNDVPWQKALEVILSTYGYGYERKGNIITVTTVENLKKRREDAQMLEGQEPLVTKTFSLNFGKASDVLDSVSKMKTARGNVNFDQRTNTLILRDSQSNVDLMSEVVKTLDSITPQVLIEVKVIETTLSNTENLGVDWVTQGAGTGWVTKGFSDETKTTAAVPFSQGSALGASLPVPHGSLLSYGTINATQLQATLELLSSRTDTSILSNPRVVTLDNNMAKIVVGSQYPFPQYTYNEQQAKLQISGWAYKDIGIIFEVTPHVNNADLVTLDLQPSITAITGFVALDPAQPNTKVPILSAEAAKTKVMVKDGQTLVIAGLIKDKTIINKSKLPFLGDIPILGEIFKKKENQKDKTELLIFLTPHIITANNPPAAATSSKS